MNGEHVFRSRCLTRIVALTLVLAIPAMFGPSAQADEGAPSCKRAGSTTVVRNSLVRVYEITRSDGAHVLFSCRRSSGARVGLARSFDDGYVSAASFDSVRLRGHQVAWAASSTDISCKADCPPGYQPTTESIELYNVRTRGSRTVAGYPFEGALVLSKRGAVAWAAEGAAPGQVEIRGSVRAGDDRLLDSGNIDPGSLAIEITIVSWMRDGLERFARLR